MSDKQLIVYTKEHCMQCGFTKKYLDDHGVEYISADVNAEPWLGDWLSEQGFKSLPVVSYGGHKFSGFRPEELTKIIEAIKND